jgi:hypothetical protein
MMTGWCFWMARAWNATGAQYTDSRLKLVARILLRGVLCCTASGSGLCGGMIPGCTAYQAVEEAFPRLIWYRTAAREGSAAAEVFANTGAAPAPRQRGPRPRWEVLRDGTVPGDRLPGDGMPGA